ncbi:MAG TPA: hypothetical protein VG052_11025 [Puia sp.]|jgi:hypothetical protein|nr:hypothetical protein [Puia sp.]
MRLPKATFFSFLILLTLPTLTIRAQLLPKDSLINDTAYATAIHQYHVYTAPETGLYRGPQYVDYDYTVQKGQPFFGPDSFRVGTIRYNGFLYAHVPLLYDLVKDQVIINDPYKVYKISLFMDLVEGFTIEDHVFILLKDSLNPSAPRSGFYEQLYQGRIILLKREKKSLQENLALPTDNIRTFIDSSVSFYLKKAGTWYPIDSKGLLLKALKERRAEVRKFIRNSNLSWHDDKEQLLLKVVLWYDGFNQ